MIRENKFKIIISSVITLLPMIVGVCFWGKISEGYEAVMRSVKIMAVFVLPSVMVLLNALCLIFTHLDSKNREQNKKVIALVLMVLVLAALVIVVIRLLPSLIRTGTAMRESRQQRRQAREEDKKQKNARRR